MASANVIGEVRRLCTAALKSNHPLAGAVITPAKWATEAGFPGSAASPLREHMARKSSNGVGRSGRYGPQDAQGMLDLLDEADAYAAAKSQKEQDAKRTRVRRALDKHRAARTSGAKQAKAGSTRRAARKGSGTELEQALDASIKQVRTRKAKTAA